jgi:hypothetical protein
MMLSIHLFIPGSSRKNANTLKKNSAVTKIFSGHGSEKTKMNIIQWQRQRQ